MLHTSFLLINVVEASRNLKGCTQIDGGIPCNFNGNQQDESTCCQHEADETHIVACIPNEQGSNTRVGFCAVWKARRPKRSK